MYLGEYAVGDDVPWAVGAQDTGGSAANAVPNQVAFRIYRALTGVVATGNMAQHDGQIGTYAHEVSTVGWAAGRYWIRMTATVDGEDPIAIYHFLLRALSDVEEIADEVWEEAKADHQGQDKMGNIAEDVDALEFTGEEG